MGRRTVAQSAHQIKRVLSPTALNDLGRRVGFCHRERRSRRVRESRAGKPGQRSGSNTSSGMTTSQDSHLGSS